MKNQIKLIFCIMMLLTVGSCQMIYSQNLADLYNNINFNKLKKPKGLLEEDKKTSNNTNNNTDKKQKNIEVEDKTLIRNFILKWDVKENHITSLPKKMREEAISICGNKRIAMTKIDTDENLKATGTFRCID